MVLRKFIDIKFKQWHFIVARRELSRKDIRKIKKFMFEDGGVLKPRSGYVFVDKAKYLFYGSAEDIKKYINKGDEKKTD